MFFPLAALQIIVDLLVLQADYWLYYFSEKQSSVEQ